MPSPTSSTLPTSARSTSVLHWRISSAMTDVISSTLNFMGVVPYSFCVSARAVDLLRAAPQQCRAQALEARGDARIDLFVADLAGQGAGSRGGGGGGGGRAG